MLVFSQALEVAAKAGSVGGGEKRGLVALWQDLNDWIQRWKNLGSNPGFAVSYLCDLGQIINLLGLQFSLLQIEKAGLDHFRSNLSTLQL